MSLGDRPGASELRAARAYAHPLRLRILSLLTGVELSAAEVARELGVTQANASYHLRKLAGAGELVIGGTEKVRGGVAKKYRYVASEAEANRTPVDPDTHVARNQAMRAALNRELERRIPLATDGPALFADAEVWVDAAVWKEAHDLVRRASMLVHDQARPPRTAGARQVSFVSWMFPMGSADERH
ncbi:ArsR/SmtB family transcription factor [Calidifontibacter terrae]